MPRSWILFFAIFLLSTLAQRFLPWWSAPVLAGALAFVLAPSGGQAFLAGLAGVGLPWLLLAGWLHVRTDGRLSHQVAELLPLAGNGWLLVLVMGLIGGLVGGLAALTGCWLRQALMPDAPATTTH